MGSDGDIERRLAALAGHLGIQLRDERIRRRLTLRELAAVAGVSPSLVHRIESGQTGSLDSYVRVADALGLRPEFDLVDPRRRGTSRAEDPVHAAMGEALATSLQRHAIDVALDEPYQHYQFAGRADLLAWSLERRALLHLENRTRFPNLQEVFGSYNAKRRYLPGVIAERLGIRGFASVTHVMVALWSAEALHTIRIHDASFRATCPDDATRLLAWLDGTPPASGVSSSLVVLDPLASSRQRQFVGRPALDTVRPRYRGYGDALEALRGRGRA